jgi:hypothetical protein
MKCAEAYEFRFYSWHLLEDLISNSVIFTEFSFDVSEWSRSIWITVDWYWLKKIIKIINRIDLSFLDLFSLMVELFNLILFFLYWSILFWKRCLTLSESYQSLGIIFFLTIYSPSCLYLYVSHLSRLLVLWLMLLRGLVERRGNTKKAG